MEKENQKAKGKRQKSGGDFALPLTVATRPRTELIQKSFNPAAFQFAPNGSNGTLGRNTLYGPGSQNWDVSFFKSFQV